MRRIVFLTPLLIIAMLAAAMPVSASAPPFGNDAFRRVWERQDRPVAEQISGRSWTWGPAPNTPALREPLLEGYEGMRVVQYFDKSRMEISNCEPIFALVRHQWSPAHRVDDRAYAGRVQSVRVASASPDQRCR